MAADSQEMQRIRDRYTRWGLAVCQVRQILTNEQTTVRFYVFRILRHKRIGKVAHVTGQNGKRYDVPAKLLHRWPMDEPHLDMAIYSITVPREAGMFKFKMRGVAPEDLTDPIWEYLVKGTASYTFGTINPTLDALTPKLLDDLRTHNQESAKAAAGASYDYEPLISIVTPLYHTPPAYLADYLDSVMAQAYPKWELVLVNSTPEDADMKQVLTRYDDERIKVVELHENLGIVGNTNAGISHATGGYVCFVDHDDMIAPNALSSYVTHINEWRDAHGEAPDVLYCDECSFEERGGKLFAPLFKPDLNRDLLYTHNYVIHLLCVSRAMIFATERSTSEVEGTQDYDLLLKCIEQGADVAHVPEMLYYWRCHEGSTNGGQVEAKPESEAAGARTLEGHLARLGHRAKFQTTDIPFVYRPRYEVADEPVTLVAYTHAQTELIEDQLPAGSQVIRVAEGAPLARGINEAVAKAAHDRIILLSDRIRGVCDELVSELLGPLVREDLGICAAKLYYRDDLVQHAGIVVHEDGALGFFNENFQRDNGGGYHGMADCVCDYSACGPDLCAFDRATWDAAGGMDEAIQDATVCMADLCFRVRNQGLAVCVNPYANGTIDAPCLDEYRTYADPDSDDIKHLWKTWGPEWRRDVLYNPYTMVNTNYIRLRRTE